MRKIQTAKTKPAPARTARRTRDLPQTIGAVWNRYGLEDAVAEQILAAGLKLIIEGKRAGNRNTFGV